MKKDNKFIWIIIGIVVLLIILNNQGFNLSNLFSVAATSQTYTTTRSCSSFMPNINNPSLSIPFTWGYTSTQYRCIQSFTSLNIGCQLKYLNGKCPDYCADLKTQFPSVNTNGSICVKVDQTTNITNSQLDLSKNYILYSKRFVFYLIPSKLVPQAVQALKDAENLLNSYPSMKNHFEKVKIIYAPQNGYSWAQPWDNTVYNVGTDSVTHEVLHVYTLNINPDNWAININGDTAGVEGQLGNLNHGGNYIEMIVHLIKGDNRWLCNYNGETPVLENIKNCQDVLAYKKWALLCNSATYNGKTLTFGSANSIKFIDAWVFSAANTGNGEQTSKEILRMLREVKTPFENQLNTICPLA